MANLSTTSKLLAIGIILVQLFDAAIHIASNQPEALRITSNVVIAGWVLAALLGWLSARMRNTSLLAIAIYVGLNLIFLAQHGLTNAEQGGAFRTMLFVLVAVTLILSGLFVARLSNAK